MNAKSTSGTRNEVALSELNTFNDFTKKFGTNTTTNFQLEKWAKQLNIKPFYYCMRDEVKNLKKLNGDFYAMINLNTSSQEGVHHTALCSKNGNLYFFCSYGDNPTAEVKSLKKSAPILCSTYRYQEPHQKLCGQLALYVLFKLSRGEDFEDILLNLI